MSFYLSAPITFATQRMLNRWFNEQPNIEAEVAFPIDVKAEDEAYVLTALLPGVTADELNIQVHDDEISIQGEFKHGRDEKGAYLLQERPAGKFSRTIELPDPLAVDQAEASLVNGVLTLRVPKAEQARPRSIKVTTK
jgi:HSP20 family protein